MHTTAGKKIPKLILKSLLWILLSLLGIVVILLISLQFSGPQKYLTGKITTYVSKKINSKVELRKISIAFPKDISLTDVYVEDLHHDTLLYAHSIKLNLNLFDLFSKKLELKDVYIDQLTAHVYREFPDTTFNYSFIPKAFSGEPTKEPVETDTTKKGFQFSIKNVELNRIYLTYHDTLSGTNADLYLGAFKTGFDEFDLAAKKIAVHTIQLKNTTAVLAQFKALKTDTTASEPFAYNLGVKEIELNNVKATYTNSVSYQDMRADIGALQVKPEKLDIKNESISVNSIALSKSAIIYTLNKNITADTLAKTVTQKEPSTNQQKSNWVISLSKLDLKSNSFVYNNKNELPATKGMDFNYLQFYNINIDSKDIHVAPEKISLVLTDLSLKEKNGLSLQKFRTNITYDQTQIELDNLDLQTDKSRISNYLGIKFKSMESIKDSIGNLQIKVNLQNTVVSVADILLFKPDLLDNPNLNIKPNTVVRLNCKLNGKVDDLAIDQLEIATLNKTALALKGHIQNVRDPKRMHADVALLKLTSSKTDIGNAVNPTRIPTSISLPEDFSVKGNFKGYTKNFDGAVFLTTSFGDAHADVKMNPAQGNKEQAYVVKADVSHFDLGKLLKKPELLGPLTMNLSVNGEGLSDTTIHAQLQTTVQEAVFNKYTYKDLVVEGVIDKKSFDGKASINDTNLVFNYSGRIDLDSSHPNYTFTFNLLGADLKALQVTKENIRMSAFIQSDLKKENTKNITGSAFIKNVKVIKGEEKYQLDSLSLTSSYKDEQADISLNSDILNANLKGNITLEQLPEALKKHFGSYFDLQQKDTLKKINPQKFDFEINLSDPSLLAEGLVPGLEKLTPFSIKGMYDSEAKNMKMDMNLSQVIYSKIIIDSLNLHIQSDPKELNCQLKVAEVSNPTLKLENIFFDSELSKNNLRFQLNTAKDDSTKMLSVAGNLKSVNGTFNLKLEPTLILNNSNWLVDSSNYIAFGKSGIIVHQLDLRHEKQSIVVNSTETGEQAPLEIKFSDFELQTLSKIIENKKELVSGTINGKVLLKKQNEVSTFSSDLKIKNLIFNEIPTGDITIVADNNEDPKKYNVNLLVSGNENEIKMTGFYLAKANESSLNFLLDINHLNLKAVEPYTFGQVTNMSGALSGKMNITGTTSAPDINGTLQFNSCEFKPKIIDSHLRSENQKITFDNKKVQFSSFTLIDSLNNKAVLDGYVDIGDLKNLPFDVHLKTDNFLALNTTEKDNPLYFGTIYLDSDIKLKGTTQHPVINAKVALNKGTVITYVKPENTSGKSDGKGIVEFIDTIQIQKNIMTRHEAEMQSTTTGLSVNASINFDKDAELKMLVDRLSGDSLYIKGSGQLEFEMDEGGKMSLVGKYRINEGGYHLTINDFIKKNFSVAKGSSVTWSGDITDPYVDLSAIYKLKASPVNLVQDELTGADLLERNKYQTLMTFLVYLKMNGFVSTPSISFDIQQPANERGALNGAVNAKLTELRGDESQLNKQVFALLALNRFMGEDPLESSGGGSISSTSRASASRILTEQLNNLSEKYVKNVDLSLGVNSFEDYSSGQAEGRTQLQLGVSKNLLDDRLTVQVGGNVDIEGEKAKENNSSNVAGNISVEYKLTEDGRYRLKGFSENQYENAIEGELTKTGIGVLYRRNYNKLRELFSKPKSKKKIAE